MSNITSLEKLNNETIAEVAPINNNFETLRVAVNDNDGRITSLRNETSYNISNINSTIQSTKESLQTQINEGLEDVQTSLNTVNKRPYITSSHVSGTSWYRVWSDGWIEQGGRSVRSGYAIIPVTFLKPYTSTNYTVIVTNTNIEKAPSKSGNDNNDAVGSFTNTGFSLITDSNFATQWYAFGK